MGCGWGWCRGCSASTRWYRARRSCPWAWGEALGCGGSYSAPPVAGWTWLKPTLSFTQLDTVIEEIPVATDGFFAISAQGNSRDLRQVRVVVRDENGEDVPGDVSVLRSVSGSFDDHQLGWVAREPLEVGTRLTATLATEPATLADRNVGGDFPLKVMGAATALF